MARKFIKKPSEVLESIVKDSLELIGINKLDETKIKLLFRLIMSGIAKHYFTYPDDLIDVGFLRFEKSPAKEELFKVSILKDIGAGVTNAETIWKYYKGDLKKEKQIKNVLNDFLENLIDYAQAQEIEITNLTSDIDNKRRRN